MWFNSQNEAKDAIKTDISGNFGGNAKIKRADHNNSKIAVYALPRNIEKKEILENLEKQGYDINDIQIVERISGNSNFLTAFISFGDNAQKENILKKGKIRIGICFYPCKKYAPKNTAQCHKCQKMGHIARNCSSIVEICGYCAGEHLTRSCTNRDKPKCINCELEKPSFHEDCKQKIKHSIENTKKSKMKVKRKNIKETKINKSQEIEKDKNEITVDSRIKPKNGDMEKRII